MTHYMQMISRHLFHLLQLEFLKELSRPLDNPNEESQFFKVNKKYSYFWVYSVNNNTTISTGAHLHSQQNTENKLVCGSYCFLLGLAVT